MRTMTLGNATSIPMAMRIAMCQDRVEVPSLAGMNLLLISPLPTRFSNDYILLEKFNNQKLGNKDNPCNSIFA